MARRSSTADPDLEFLIETVSPEVGDRLRLKQILRADEAFRREYAGDEKVFRRLMGDEELFLRISPRFFFEILLRRAARDLQFVGYTIERAPGMTIPVFDTREILDLLANEGVLMYLADMLASFTKIESYTFSFRARKGMWRKIRFNDFDIRTLMSFCEVAQDAYKFGLYKRIADVCLFILGLFPDHAEGEYRYPRSGQIRPRAGGAARISPEEYENEGRRFYKLAAEHPLARDLEMTEVLGALHEKFNKAKKPLSFMAEHYMAYRRDVLFS
ncbi:MAG: hypothetical protein AB1640_13545 [bacterium]